MTLPAAVLRAVPTGPAVDVVAAERAVGALLRSFGREAAGSHLADTPRRVALAYAEVLTPRRFDLTTFPIDEGYDEMVAHHHLGAAGAAPRGRPLARRVPVPHPIRRLTGGRHARSVRHRGRRPGGCPGR